MAEEIISDDGDQKIDLDAEKREADLEELEDAVRALEEAYFDFKSLVKRKAPRILFERWKAGGYLVDTDILSMYPNAFEVAKDLGCTN